MYSRIMVSFGFVALGSLSSAIDGASTRADATAFAISPREFETLSRADQRSLVVSAFERRLEHSRNFSGEMKARIAVHEYSEGKIGSRLGDGNGRNYRIWRLGDVVRMDIAAGGPTVEKPVEFISSVFDASKGVGKSWVRRVDNSRSYGRVDVKPDPMTEDNRFAYWLDGKHTRMGEHLFRYLVDHKVELAVSPSVEGGFVQITVPWQPPWSDKPIGHREFTLDPQKGFMPVHGMARCDLVRPNGKPDWLVEEFTVLESQLVGDVWMPTRLRELISNSVLGDKKRTVWDTTATDLVHGKVSPKDVEVEFPPGAEIVDAIQGIAYTVGPDLKPTKIEQLIGDRGLPVPQPRSWWPYIVGSVLAIVALVFVLRVRSRHRVIHSQH